MAAEVASFDIAAGEPTRILVGLFGPEFTFVTGGAIDVRFVFTGDRDGSEAAIETEEVRAQYLPVLGAPGTGSRQPRLTSPAAGRGVYAAHVTFERAGFWEAVIGVHLQGETPQTVSALFEVKASHEVPARGELAPDAVVMSTLHSGRPAATIDSRAFDGEEVPDPELHDVSIAEALAAGWPVVAVFSTPVYCVSRFCGPVTDLASELHARYSDRAAFVHVEMFEDFERNRLNPGVVEWLDEIDGVNEPWVFLIGGDGVILDRWDNVIDRDELEAALDALPVLPAGSLQPD